MKGRKAKNIILSIHRKDETFTKDKEKIAKKIMDFFKNFLNKQERSINEDEIAKLINYKLSSDQSLKLDEEINQGHSFCYRQQQGFWANRFKVTIKHFFVFENLLREANCTILALILSALTLIFVKIFKSITCCNIFNKCITKIMDNQFKSLLPNFINIAQGAFVATRRIRNNILLCQKLFQKYNKDKQNIRRFVIKVDLMKTYYTKIRGLSLQC